jgi:hypothetical protein
MLLAPENLRGLQPATSTSRDQDLSPANRVVPSMRRPVSVKRFLFFSLSFFISSFSKLFPLGRAASVATLPSALFVERSSLGASWVYSIQ